jgi:predicted DNA binding CopG/RHH family protein
MQTVNFVEALQQDIRELAQIGGDELVESARRLEGAVRQSATLRLIDLLTEAALELSEQLPSGHVDLRIAGQEPQLVYVEEAAATAEPAPPAADDEQARITLRLPESLKAALEAAAAAEGVSVNTWLVRALQRAISGGGGGGRSPRSGKRITGFSQA